MRRFPRARRYYSTVRKRNRRKPGVVVRGDKHLPLPGDDVESDAPAAGAAAAAEGDEADAVEALDASGAASGADAAESLEAPAAGDDDDEMMLGAGVE